MPQATHKLRLIGFLALILGYSIVANFTLQSKEYASIGAFVAIAPILFTCLILALRAKRRMIMLALLVLISPLFWFAWAHFKAHYEWIYWLEHESLQVVLLIMFARTLLPKQQPLCTQFAEIVHGQLSPELIRYTRQVTIAWAVFFTCIILISSWLFFFFPVSVWSIFSNFIYLPLVGTMFAVEYMIRTRVLPKKDQASMMDAIYAFMDKSKS